MGTKCGGTYTGLRSLRKGSYPRSVALGPDDARESSATSSLRDHPWVRAMSFRVLHETRPAPARLDAPAWSSALAVMAVFVLTAGGDPAKMATWGDSAGGNLAVGVAASGDDAGLR